MTPRNSCSSMDMAPDRLRDSMASAVLAVVSAVSALADSPRAAPRASSAIRNSNIASASDIFRNG